MNTKILDAMTARLNAEDSQLLCDIYEPTAVAVPDANAWGGLCVMKDGRLRFYGGYRCKDVFGKPDTPCYLESTDCGLSWKRHLTDYEKLGASTYVPFLDRYIGTRSEEDGSLYVRIGVSPDEPPEKEIPLGSDQLPIDVKLPFVMTTRDRVLLLAHQKRPAVHPYCYYGVLFYSDNGEDWRRVNLGEAPYFEKKWPHEGIRWQQNNREQTVEELSDGSLLMISRTATDYHYGSRSTDGGETWSAYTPTRFHATGTMPYLKRLHDGRLLFFWCNTKMLPELPDADGKWEDVFTNRDVNHAAVSEDDGKTWIGYRELFLNPVRNNADFRTVGGLSDGIDKSVHQFEVTELPYNKVLVVFGQHEICRRIVIFDLDWLYEKTRAEDFTQFGLARVSTHSYVKSVLGGWRGKGYGGHCAYNRVSGALLLPHPLDGAHEALHLTAATDERIVYPRTGAVWNFPITRHGVVSVTALIKGAGLRVSLDDHFMNPCDPTVEYCSPFSLLLRKDMAGCGDAFVTFRFTFDCDAGTVTLTAGDTLSLTLHMAVEPSPDGLCYVHLQSPDSHDAGAYITTLEAAALT